MDLERGHLDTKSFGESSGKALGEKCRPTCSRDFQTLQVLYSRWRADSYEYVEEVKTMCHIYADP
jgi:hypothetical protein